MAGIVPTTVWDDLNVSQVVQFGVPFIDPNTLQPTVDAPNFAFKESVGVNLTGSFFLGNSGDFTGTDILNLGAQGDSYMPTTLQDLATIGKSSGWTVSTSRGSRAIPAVVLNTDYVGEFSAYGYMGIAGAESYKLVSSIKHYISGASATDPGGEMRLGTKQNGGAYTEWIKLKSAGIFAPLAQGTVALGEADKGFSRITLDYTISAVVGAVAINKPAGSGNIAAGANNVVITNNLVTVNSLVTAWLMGNDATLTSIKSIIPANGSFTITGNANATGNLKVGFLVISTDS